jgi:Asp-tRNA(Asn)/Glu-tRNA(Gln) amidotransferase B subunit
MQNAIEYEIERQIEAHEKAKRYSETRLWTKK